MNKVTVSGKDGFWARVRAVLGQGEDASRPAYGQSEISKTKGASQPTQLIDDELRLGWMAAAERKVSLCVLVMEMDGFPEYVAAYGREALEASLASLETTISALLPRETDLCLRSGRAGFTLILPDMPMLMARDLAARIAAALRRAGLQHRESHAGQVTLSMGLAVINPSGEVDSGVLNTATLAVSKAQRRGLARLEVVDLRGDEDKRQAA